MELGGSSQTEEKQHAGQGPKAPASEGQMTSSDPSPSKGDRNSKELSPSSRDKSGESKQQSQPSQPKREPEPKQPSQNQENQLSKAAQPMKSETKKADTGKPLGSREERRVCIIQL